MIFREEGEIGSKRSEEGEIDSESREKGDLPPCSTPLSAAHTAPDTTTTTTQGMSQQVYLKKRNFYAELLNLAHA